MKKLKRLINLFSFLNAGVFVAKIITFSLGVLFLFSYHSEYGSLFRLGINFLTIFILFVFIKKFLKCYISFLTNTIHFDKSIFIPDNYSFIFMKYKDFISIYRINKESWGVDKDICCHYRVEYPYGRGGYKVKYNTYVIFSPIEFLKYYNFIKKMESEAQNQEDMEEYKKELNLNLKFLDSINKDVERMKTSAEAELNKNLLEMKKIQESYKNSF